GPSRSYLDVIETTLHLTAYERMKDISTKQGGLPDCLAENEVVQGVILSSAAGISKLAAVLIAYPHEVIRTRLCQAPLPDGRQKYTGVIQCLRVMWREGGAANMYGGLTAHLIRTVPSAAITLGAYELVLRALRS
ncbi:hypothetical protein AJ80_09568, partial [Polytolypa hystricis UAMH7299]